MVYGGGSTQTSVSTLVSPTSDLLLASMEGAATVLVDSIKASLNTPNIQYTWVSGRQHMRKWALQTGNQAIQFPAVAFQIKVLEIPKDGYAAFASKNLGFKGATSNDFTDVYHMVPVVVTFTTRFIAQNQLDILKFSSGWLFKSENSFSLSDDSGFEVAFKLLSSEVLDLPELELDETGPLFTLESETHLYTYVGNKQAVPTVKYLQFNTNITDGVANPIRVDERQFNVDQ